MKTSFDIMWPDSKHRNWLKWRTTVLVEEDVYYMLGELAEFYVAVKGKKGKEEETMWRRFLYTLALCRKSKDTESLWMQAESTTEKENEHPELVTMRWWLNQELEVEEKGEKIYQQMLDSQVERGFTEYELEAAKVMKARMYQGGMAADRQACLASIILIMTRRLNKEDVQVRIKEGFDRWKKEHRGRKPVDIELPWYVFDMHTAIGKFALSVFAKNEMKKFPGLTKAKIDDIWFDLESAFIPPNQITYTKIIDEPTPFDNMWWPKQVREDLPFGGMTAKEVKTLWDTKLKTKIGDLVWWCTAKRASERR